jgi:hypothetical protein
MTASARADRSTPIRVSTLLDLLARRQRRPGETADHARLQSEAEVTLARLVAALGPQDEAPMKLLIAERDWSS